MKVNEIQPIRFRIFRTDRLGFSGSDPGNLGRGGRCPIRFEHCHVAKPEAQENSHAAPPEGNFGITHSKLPYTWTYGAGHLFTRFPSSIRQKP
ncbi:hypothetical protein CRG98_003270 [Punica granatum]|uniref:Uncharacterized protein n=1 Tax=Punica granatum TaxID=22663 RepID=A0A2I0L6M0_PUNGR|nr:hypothetical protein CRG98_003270 [Punica granatum]